MAKKAHMSHSGQTAMEYLLTYGWAILVVLVVIGALVFFGVLSPQKFLPEKCTLSSGFQCTDFVVTTTQTQINVLNGGTGPVQFLAPGITIYKPDGVTVCASKLPAGASGTVDLLNLGQGQQSQYTITCAPGVAAGTRTRLKVEFNYKDVTSGITHKSSGDLIADVE